MAVPALLGGARRAPLSLCWAAAFLLDAVDGAVARRTGSSSPAGGRLDVQTDAALVLVLSCAAVRALGRGSLPSGCCGTCSLPPGRSAPLCEACSGRNRLRKVIGAYQPFALLLALTPGVPEGLGAGAVVLALLTLVASFGLDVLELERSHRMTGRRPGAELVN